MGPEWDDGLPYFTAFYFSFISLTTIGLGDVMPNNVPYAPPVSIIFFVGMAVTKVVNRATFIAVENGVFGLMTLAETKIDSFFTKRSPKEVHNIRPAKKCARPGVVTRSSSDSSSASSSDASSLSSSSNSSETSENLTVDRRRNDLMNGFTVRSIATFMRSNHDVYGGGFGRVQLRRGDLMNNAHTVSGAHGFRVRPTPP
ncbi:unnamed protein product [Caenorhabditis sp. 36 PRJEB53466]|nr:unnamed protein product [Caenorhabditis sp. 36 PRJEB53466]